MNGCFSYRLCSVQALVLIMKLQSVEILSPTAARRVHAGPGIMIHGAQSEVVRESQGIPHITSTHPEHFLFHFIPLN